MTGMVSVQFEYKQNSYQALISTKENGDDKEHRITVMNGELEKLLFGHHILIEKNGNLLLTDSDEDSEVAQLRKAVAGALSNYLKQLIRL
jgi:hypothetical protein